MAWQGHRFALQWQWILRVQLVLFPIVPGLRCHGPAEIPEARNCPVSAKFDSGLAAWFRWTSLFMTAMLWQTHLMCSDLDAVQPVCPRNHEARTCC